MRFRSIPGMVAAVAGTFLLSVLIAAPEVQAQPADKPLVTLRYASWGPKLMDQADFFVAEELGYFKEEGLNVEWITAQGNGDALRHVIAGNADIAATDPVVMLFGLDRGAKVKAFYAVTPHNQFTVIARKSKGINSIADLRGKKIAVVSMASGSRYNVMTILNAHKMSEADVTLIATGLNFGGPLEQGQVDAAGTWQIINWDLMNRVLPKAIVDDLIVFNAKDDLEVPTNVFAATEEVLASKRDALIRFARAHRRGTEFMHANPEKAAEIAAKHIISAKDDKNRALAIVKLRMAMQVDASSKENGFGWLSEDILNNFAKKYNEWGLIKNVYTFKDFATNDLLKDIKK